MSAQPKSDIAGWEYNHPDKFNIGNEGLEEIKDLVFSYNVGDILDAISHYMIEMSEEDTEARDVILESSEIVAHASKHLKC